MARGGKVHFVRSTQINPGQVLSFENGTLWQNSAQIFDRLEAICGRGASDLFAEPNVKQQDQGRLIVAWFANHDEEAKQLDALDRSMRTRVGADLAAKIEALRPALNHPELGEAIAAMLNLADEKSVVAMGDSAVLTNWGLLPEEAQASRAAFAKHSERTIGSFLPPGISPRVPGQTWTIAGGTSDAGLSPPRRAAAEPAVRPHPVGASTARPITSNRPIWFWPFALLSAIFAIVLAYALWPGALIYPEAVAASPGPALVDRDEINRSLEERIAKLREALAAGCEADPSLLGAPLDQAGTTPGAGGAPAPAESSNALLNKLDIATVLVIARSAESTSTGSGFFVTENVILTNRHVVEAAGDTVLVASKALGAAIEAQVLARSADGPAGTSDFALLQIANAPATIAPLILSDRVERLENVVAAGFPGLAMEMDDSYQRILSGDATGVQKLEMVVTQGNVMATPNAGSAKLITHSASISPGNSGGPLSDTCGRAVGINTFIRTDGNNEKLNFSLGAADALRFLSSNGIRATPANGACTPAAGGSSGGGDGGAAAGATPAVEGAAP